VRRGRSAEARSPAKPGFRREAPEMRPNFSQPFYKGIFNIIKKRFIVKIMETLS
jgi:hypothetical protein